MSIGVRYTKHNIKGVKYISPKEEMILESFSTQDSSGHEETIGIMVAKTDKND